MSGRGSDSLAGKILNELRTAFALLTKNLKVTEVSTDVSPDLIYFQLGFAPQTQHWELTQERVRTQLLRVHWWVKTFKVSCIHQAILASARHCGFNPVLTESHLFQRASAQIVKPVIHRCGYKGGVLELPTALLNHPCKTYEQVAQVPAKPSHAIHLVPPKGSNKHHSVKLLRVKPTHRFPPKLVALPIERAGIPLHRFKSEQRIKFLQALAEKAKVPIQTLKIMAVYDRVLLGCYQSIRQNDRGALVCMPKVGEQLSSAKAEQPMYLIFGTKINENQLVTALLPMNALSSEDPNAPNPPL